MSLLDDVSIVVTPNGYKAGELYAVKPNNGDADMDVTRATDATRVDENGLIKKLGANVPRIDYTGGGCPHILAEPQRTNIVTYSETYGSGTFFIGTSGSTIDNTTNISPSGDANATQLTSTGAGKLQSGGLGLTQNTDYVLSFYAKNVDATLVNSRVLGLGGSGGTNLTSVDYTSQLSTTEWTRITHTFNTGTNTTIYVYLSSSLNSGGTIQLWGAQLEEGSYATSYIPTSGSTVTRNQDIFTRDGIGSLINSTEGTLVIEPRYFINDGDATGRKISISDGTGTNRIYITPYQGLASRIRYIFTNGGATQADLQVTGIDITVSRKLAFVWATNRFELWQNGYKISEDTSGATPSAGTFNQIHFGSETGNGTELFEGELKQLQVYTTALSDDQIRQITQ